MNDEFYEYQIFEGDYPPEAADWCNKSNSYHIDEIESIVKMVTQPIIDENGEETTEETEEIIRRFQIVKNSEPTQYELIQIRISELQYFLTSTDWYAIRFADTREPIPDDIKQQRKDARAEISRLRESISD